jgi:hypothetical protein
MEIVSQLWIYSPVTSSRCWNTYRTTRNRRTLVTETYFGSSTNQIAHAVSLDTNHANAFVAAGAEKCWSPVDHCGGEMHDVFIVISEGSDGEHVARTVYAASEDDARQTHRENYPDEPIVAVHQ